jgi:DNA-binding Lrp family transcriptional regulator
MTARNPNNLQNGNVFAPLNRIDRELVIALQKNARASNKELAELVGLAPSTCLERLRRLRARGVLRGFHADVDLDLLGRRTQAMLAVRLRAHDRELIASFYDHAINLPESVAVMHVSGVNDYLLHVAVRDTEHLRILVLDQITARPEVEHVETQLIFEHVRKRAVEPLDD